VDPIQVNVTTQMKYVKTVAKLFAGQRFNVLKFYCIGNSYVKFR